MRVPIALLALLLGGCAKDIEVSVARECTAASQLIQKVVKVRNSFGMASAVIVGPKELLTVEHVSEQMRMSSTPQEITVSQQNDSSTNEPRTVKRAMRLKQSFFVDAREELHLWEMDSSLEWNSMPLVFRETPLVHREPATGIGYPAGHLTFTSGEFRTDGPVKDPFYALAAFRMESISFFGGSSGGGVFDCEGRLIGLIARAFDQAPSRFEQIWVGVGNTSVVPAHAIAHMFSR